MPSVEVRNERSRCFEFWIIWKFCQNEFHGHISCLHVSRFCTSSQKEESNIVSCKEKVFSKLRHMLMFNSPWSVEDFLRDLRLVSFQLTTGSVWAMCMLHVGWGKRRHQTPVKLTYPCKEHRQLLTMSECSATAINEGELGRLHQMTIE